MMDRALKERIIGAVVIVLFVVLVVPVFLDGKSDDSRIVSERVPLPGQAEQELQTIVLDRDRKEPVPAAGAGVTDESTPKPQVAIAKKDPPPATPEAPLAAQQEAIEVEVESEDQKPAPAPAPAPKPAASASQTGMWAVQLGSFGSQENAERLAADLRKQGFAAFLSQLSTGSGPLHRVRIGPQKDRESAEAMAERLAKAGHKGQVVPHP